MAYHFSEAPWRAKVDAASIRTQYFGRGIEDVFNRATQNQKFENRNDKCTFIRTCEHGHNGVALTN